MCILCTMSKWSRCILTRLLWLLIPIITSWTLSQLLPPDFRFEVTSKRLACVLVILFFLIWYKLVIPQISSWKEHRAALLRERKRLEAHKTAKWRKEALRMCRNCSAAYRDQAPGGGRFMCTYCGHASKRPALGFPVPSDLIGVGKKATLDSSTGWSRKAFEDMAGWRGFRERGGKKQVDDANGWNASASWLDASWQDSYHHKLQPGERWSESTGRTFCTEANCFAEEGCFGSCLFLLKSLLPAACWQWTLKIWTKMIAANSGQENEGSDCHRDWERKADNESRIEKTRRKAEERRQARLKKELLEAEERKQREDVARLVEENRRLRSKNTEVERESEKEPVAGIEREIKRQKDADRRRQGKAREKGEIKDVCKEPEEEVAKKKVLNERNLVAEWDKGKEGKHSKSCMGSEQCGDNLFINSFQNSTRAYGRLRNKGSGRGYFQTTMRNSQTGANHVSPNWRSLMLESNARSKLSKPVATSVVQVPSQVTEPAWKNSLWTKAWSQKVVGIEPKPLSHVTNSVSDIKIGNECSDQSSEAVISTNELETAEPKATVCLCNRLLNAFSSEPPIPTNSKDYREDINGDGLENKIYPTSVCELLRDSIPIDLEASVLLKTKLKPLSPIHGPVSAPTNMPSPILQSQSILSECVKEDGQIGKDEVKHALEPWSLPSFSLNGDESLNEDMDGGGWQLWGGSIFDPSSLTKLLHNEVLEHDKLSSQLAPQGLKSVPYSDILTSESSWTDSLLFESGSCTEEDPDFHQKVPPEFIDCITQEIMKDPVITADGHSYERSAIVTWLKSHDTSPKTGEVLPPPPGGIGVDKSLRPNHILRGQILEYKRRRVERSLPEDSAKENLWGPVSGSSSTWSTVSMSTRPCIGGLCLAPDVKNVWS